MAREKNAWERMREKEKLREEEERGSLTKDTYMRMPNGAPAIGGKLGASGEPLIVELINRAEIMMEQIQNLYNMYIAGLERIPPTVQRRQLDDVILKITTAAKPTAALLFRVNQFNAKVSLYREKWDKLLRDVEAGKVVIRRKT